MLKQFKPAYGG